MGPDKNKIIVHFYEQQSLVFTSDTSDMENIKEQWKQKTTAKQTLSHHYYDHHEANWENFHTYAF